MESQIKSRPQPVSSSGSDFVTSLALKAELRSFCSAHHLTPRESEILGSLVEGVVRIKDIAARMSLSPNTVNNHVNSIFVKTKSRSKSQLLSHLLTYVAEELHVARALRRCVRVAIVDVDASESAKLVAELSARGFEAAAFEASFPMTAWPMGLGQWRAEFIVVDQVTMAMSALSVLIDEARDMGAQVAFCGQMENALARRSAMANGAIDWFAKPCDYDRLLALFVAHSVPNSDPISAMARAILFEKGAQAFVVGVQSIKVGTQQFGRGGVFISNDELKAAMGRTVQIGDWVKLQLHVDSRPDSTFARGQIVWLADDGESPGAGVRFSFLDPETQTWLASIVREQRTASYIPASARRSS